MNNKGNKINNTNATQKHIDEILNKTDVTAHKYTLSDKGSVRIPGAVLGAKKNKIPSSTKSLLVSSVVVLSISFIIFLFSRMENTPSISKSTTIAANKTTVTNKSSSLEYPMGTSVMRDIDNVRLSSILGDYNYSGNYEHVVKYEGIYFKFICYQYNSEKDRCVDGENFISTTTDDNKSHLIKFFDFSSDVNYIEDSNLLYISINNDKVLVTRYNDDEVTGNFSLYDFEGNVLNDNIEFTSEITIHYDEGPHSFYSLIPKIDDGKINYFTCNSETNEVKNYVLTLEDNSITELTGKYKYTCE